MHQRESLRPNVLFVVWLKPRETQRANTLGLHGTHSLLAGCLLHADLGAIPSDASAVGRTRGQRLAQGGQKIPHLLFCFGCHLNRWPHDVRTNNQYSWPGGLIEYSCKKCVCGGFARTPTGVFCLTQPPPEPKDSLDPEAREVARPRSVVQERCKLVTLPSTAPTRLGDAHTEVGDCVGTRARREQEEQQLPTGPLRDGCGWSTVSRQPLDCPKRGAPQRVRRRQPAGAHVPAGCRQRPFFGARLFVLSKGSGDAGHHGRREGGVPALRDVLRRPLPRPQSLLRGDGGLHPSGLSVWQPGRKVRLGQERVPNTCCVRLGEKSSSLALPVLPSSNVQFTEGRHPRKSTVRGATSPLFTVDRLPKTSTIHEWHTSNTSTFHGRQTSNNPTVHGGQSSKASMHGGQIYV